MNCLLSEIRHDACTRPNSCLNTAVVIRWGMGNGARYMPLDFQRFSFLVHFGVNLTADSTSLEAFHMKCQRRVLRISWQHFVRIEQVRSQTCLQS